MNRERLIWSGLAAVLVLGLIFGAVSSGQRDAWLEGYTMGRLAATSGDGAAVVTAPYLPYAYGAAPRGLGFGGFLFLLVGAGLLFFLVTRFARMAQWRAWMAQGGPGGQGGAPVTGPGWQGPPPWAQHRMRWGCQGEQAQSAPASPPAPAAATQPSAPPQAPAATPPAAG
jgi:hypothetical protein